MQARVISGGDAGFEALVYTQPDGNLLNYINNSINSATAKLGNIASNFIDTTRSIYENYNSAAVINSAKALVSTLDNHINPDVIIRYNTSTVFNATPKMQEYIMVQPELFDLNRNQQCSAYDDMYYNVDPSVKNVEEHIRYKEVMDGMLQFDDNGDGFIVSYSSSEIDDLHPIDQFSIRDTWDAVADLIANGIDPSSPDGDEL